MTCCAAEETTDRRSRTSEFTAEMWSAVGAALLGCCMVNMILDADGQRKGDGNQEELRFTPISRKSLSDQSPQKNTTNNTTTKHARVGGTLNAKPVGKARKLIEKLISSNFNEVEHAKYDDKITRNKNDEKCDPVDVFYQHTKTKATGKCGADGRKSSMRKSGAAKRRGAIRLKFPVGGKTLRLDLVKSKSQTSRSKVFIGERGRVMGWTPPGAEKYIVYEDKAHCATFVQISSKKHGRYSRYYIGTFVANGVMHSIRPYYVDIKQQAANVDIVTVDGAIYRITQIDAPVDFTSFEGPEVISENAKRRNKRHTATPGEAKQNYSLELLLVVDYAIFNRWFVESLANLTSAKRQDAIQNIRYYYANVINGVNMRYSTIREPDFSISVSLVGFYIATTPADSPWTESSATRVNGSTYVQAYRALDRFDKWINTLEPLITFDHAALFTGNTLFTGNYSDGTRAVISGLSNIQGVCDPVKKTSINDENGEYASTQTATHELGHNLGALHDGDGNICSSSTQYVMASGPQHLTNVTVGNPFQFSSCSIDYFRSFLASLSTNNRNCLLNAAVGINANISVYPGTRYNVDRQCQIIVGPASFYCAGGSRDRSICREMQCWVPERSGCYAGIEQRAFDGTTCGNQSWCMMGHCVRSDLARQGQDSCIYGDYRGYFTFDSSTRLNCSQIGVTRPYLCYDPSYATDCCRTCNAIRNYSLPEGCEYGNDDPGGSCSLIQRHDCYDVSVRQRCCVTCAAERNATVTSGSVASTVAGCEYGNKASWCAPAQLPPFQCYSLAGQTCCETCATYRTGPPGCEFGDRVFWCRTYPVLDCSDPQQLTDCCRTCARRGVPPPPDARPSPPPSTTPRPAGVPRPATSGAAGSGGVQKLEVGSCPLGDAARFCASMPREECYEFAQLCCVTCAKYYTGRKGCEYGNAAPWCSTYVQGPLECTRPEVSSHCCQTCSRWRSMIQARQVCLDKASWCSGIFSGQCYDSSVEKTCCATCSRYRTNRPDCIFGNRFSWCNSEYCTENGAECCVTCAVTSSDGVITS